MDQGRKRDQRKQIFEGSMAVSVWSETSNIQQTASMHNQDNSTRLQCTCPDYAPIGPMGATCLTMPQTS